MGISITFTMRRAKRLFGRDHTVWDHLASYAVSLGQELGYRCDAVQDCLIYQPCPEGFLWMRTKDKCLVGECQTNLAGPGFHAAMIHFLELFASRAGLSLEVEDETGYYEDRDFIKLKKDYFCRWFSGLMKEVWKRSEERGEQLVCWPSDYYVPEEKEGTVMTHICRYSLPEIYGRTHSGISMAFAKDFFIWNEETKDAYFYRNSALVLLNQECYFMPSERSKEDQEVNDKILNLLEKALLLDREVPFPTKEYLELCSLAGHQPVDLTGVQSLPDGIELGCRKGLLYRTIGCVRFAVPGNFLYDFSKKGNAEHYYDHRGNEGRDYYICAIHTEKEAEFQEAPFQKEHITKIVEFSVGDARCKAAVYRPVEKDNKMSCTLAAQVVYKNQITVISINYANPKEQEWAMKLLKQVKTV